MEKGGYQDSRKEEDFSFSHATTPSRPPRAHYRLPSMVGPSLNPLCLRVSSNGLDGEGLYQVPC
jgi:hypothetical protein